MITNRGTSHPTDTAAEIRRAGRGDELLPADVDAPTLIPTKGCAEGHHARDWLGCRYCARNIGLRRERHRRAVARNRR